MSIAAGEESSSTETLFADGAIPSRLPLGRKGFFGGGQIGYNYQFAGTGFVVGLEADFQFLNAKASATYTTPSPSIFYTTSKLAYLGTVRGRVGYAVVPSFLLYVTVGLAYGQVKALLKAASLILYSFSTSNLLR